MIQEQGGRVDGFCIFVKVPDEKFEEVIKDDDYLKDILRFQELFDEDGDNIIIFGLVVNNPNYILSGLNSIIDKFNPKSIFWLRDTKRKANHKFLMRFKNGKNIHRSVWN